MSAPFRSPSLTLRPGTPEEVGMLPERIQRLSELGQQWVQEGVTPAMVLLVARRGRIVLHEAFGKLPTHPDSPPTPLNALFSLDSIGKVFTATAVMVLVEEGRVGLNRPVSTYIPEFQGEGKDRVLVRHLLTHTSGLRDEDVEKFAQENQGKIAIPRAGETLHPVLNEWLALRYSSPLWKPPGEEMSYASFGFELLGEIIRRVSRTSIDRFYRARIYQPLGMNDTFDCAVDAPPERRAKRVPDPTVVLDAVDLARETGRLPLGSGGQLTTAKDLAVFGQMFLNGGTYGAARVLSPASVAAMTCNQIPGIRATYVTEVFPEATWGLGWGVHGSKTGRCGGLYSPEAFEHSGGSGAYVWVDPTYGIVGIYLSLSRAWRFAPNWTEIWQHDLFADAVTASVADV